MAEDTARRWSFLTNHARALICIQLDPGMRLRDIGDRIGITERAAFRIVNELDAAGYITREKNGRRNRYTIIAQAQLSDPLVNEPDIGTLLEILSGTPVVRQPEGRNQNTG